MMQRCYNPKQENYARYGAKGITVDERWHTPANFLADMGQPEDGQQLDRIDSTKGYSKDNCRWVSLAEQNANRRHVQKLPDGRIAAHVAKENGISSFHRRMRLGWSLEEACTRPSRTLTHKNRPKGDLEMPYYRKRKPFEAIQFRATPAVIAEVMDFTRSLGGQRAIKLNDAGQPIAFSVNTPAGLYYALPGDWVIRDYKGQIYLVSADLFETEYEQI